MCCRYNHGSLRSVLLHYHKIRFTNELQDTQMSHQQTKYKHPWVYTNNKEEKTHQIIEQRCRLNYKLSASMWLRKTLNKPSK